MKNMKEKLFDKIVKDKKISIILSCCFLLIICIVIGVSTLIRHAKEEEQARIEKEQQQAVKDAKEYNEMVECYYKICDLSYTGASSAEKICVTTYNTWKDSIFNSPSEDTKKYELLLLSAINEIYSTPEISNKSAFAPYTVFEIMGRLAKTYTLYEGERVIKIKEDSIVVSNNYEDKAELYKRLLRYGTLCKIISTQDDIERFKQMLNKMEKALLASVVS